jgi:hypothetical protein
MNRTPGFLTSAELAAMDMTVALVNLVCREVIGHGPTRQHDVAEFCAAIHHVQATILSQAAGRAYPDRFRTLGETLSEEVCR